MLWEYDWKRRFCTSEICLFFEILSLIDCMYCGVGFANSNGKEIRLAKITLAFDPIRFYLSGDSCDAASFLRKFVRVRRKTYRYFVILNGNVSETSQTRSFRQTCCSFMTDLIHHDSLDYLLICSLPSIVQVYVHPRGLSTAHLKIILFINNFQSFHFKIEWFMVIFPYLYSHR